MHLNGTPHQNPQSSPPEIFLIGGPEHGKTYSPAKMPPPQVVEFKKGGAAQLVAASTVPRIAAEVPGDVVERYTLFPCGVLVPGMRIQGVVYRWDGPQSEGAFGSALTLALAEFLARGPDSGEEEIIYADS